MLTKNQFALLSYIAARPAGEPALSQRAIAQGTGKALGTVNGLVKELSAMGCLDGARSEERRVGKECNLSCRSRWSPYH